MAAKQIVFDDAVRDSIRAGVKKLADAVKCTLGPRGRNVIINKSFGSPHVTKDGVTVAEEIELKDPYENMGAQMVKEVASKTGNAAVRRTPLLYSPKRFRRAQSGHQWVNLISLKNGIDRRSKLFRLRSTRPALKCAVTKKALPMWVRSRPTTTRPLVSDCRRYGQGWRRRRDRWKKVRLCTTKLTSLKVCSSTVATCRQTS